MNIRTKLIAAFAGLAILVLLVSTLAVSALSADNGRFGAYVQGVRARAAAAAEVRNAVDQRAIAARNLVLVSKPVDVDAEKAAVVKAHQQVGAHLGRLKDMIAAASPDVSP